jgi:hypothetical protein
MIDIRKLQNDWEFVVAFYSLVFVMKQRFWSRQILTRQSNAQRHTTLHLI